MQRLYQYGPLYAETRAGLDDEGSLLDIGVGLRLRRNIGWLTVSLGLIGFTIGCLSTRPKPPAPTEEDPQLHTGSLSRVAQAMQ